MLGTWRLVLIGFFRFACLVWDETHRSSRMNVLVLREFLERLPVGYYHLPDRLEVGRRLWR